MATQFPAACLDSVGAYASTSTQPLSFTKSGQCDRLNAAIHRFVYPVFQPVVHAPSGRVEYFELLARVRGDASLTRHRKLIEVCERVGLIHRIDFFMLENALALLSARPDLSVACNVSLFTVEVEGDGYLERLARHTAVAGRLVIEITESRPVQHLPAVTRFAGRVRALGSRIALDDVGAGYFTLQDIADIRADFVKLDAALMARACAREHGHGTACGHPLDIAPIKAAAAACCSQLIAEGIESAALLSYAGECGISLVQGYFTGRPAALPCAGRVGMKAA